MVKGVVNGVETYYPGRHYNEEVDGSTSTVKKFYTMGSTTVAVRTVSGTEDVLNWVLGDHLGSASITANADGSWNSEIKYTAFGEVRASSGLTPTEYRYTGQLEAAELGLYFYVARWYDPYLNQFAQPDTYVPESQGAQSFDRYAYAYYSPLNYIDPSGHVAAEFSGGFGGKCDYMCQSNLRRDILIKKVLEGSGENGDWTSEDIEYYYANKEDVWNDINSWYGDDRGWNGFATHVQRLASHYSQENQEEFVRDFSLIFGGVPIGIAWPLAALSVARGPHDLAPLGESNTGLASEFLDSDYNASNQSHHYAGLFFIGYYAGSPIANTICFERERDTLNSGDVLLGDRAIADAVALRRKNIDFQELVNQIISLTIDLDQ